VCFYRGAYRFLFSVRVAIPFFGKISAKPSARHDVLRRGIPLRAGLSCPYPAAGFINPCRPGQLQEGCAHQPILYLPVQGFSDSATKI